MNFKRYFAEVNYKELMALTKAAKNVPHEGVYKRGKERAPVRLVSVKKNGRMYWKTKSLTTEDVDEWDQTVQLMDFSKVLKEGAGEKLTSRVRDIVKGDVRVRCQCDSFQYWGYAYILTELDAIVGATEKRAPVIRNPDEEGALCVHLVEVLKVLPFYTGDISKEVKSNNWYGY